MLNTFDILWFNATISTIPAEVSAVVEKNVDSWPSGIVLQTLDPTIHGQFLQVAIVIAVIGLVLMLLSRRRSATGAPHCRRCFHDLTGFEPLPEVCPECGRAVEGRVIRSRLDPLQLARRQRLGRIGTTLALAGGIVFLFAGYLHPARYRMTPGWWLLNIDAAWAFRMPGSQEDGFFTMPSRITGPFHHSVWNRGRAGDFTDDELEGLASAVLARERRGRQVSITEADLYVGTAVRAGLLTPATLLESKILNPWMDRGAGSIEILRATSSGIRLRATLCTRAPGLDLSLTHAHLRGDLEMNVRVVGGRVGDVEIEEAQDGLQLSGFLTSGVRGLRFDLEPPKGSTFEPGPTDIECEIELEFIWLKAPGGPRVLHRQTTRHRAGKASTILSHPPQVEDPSACRELERRLRDGASFEMDESGRTGRLILRLPKTSAIELGVPRISLILASTGPDREMLLRMEPRWRDLLRTARQAVFKDPDLERRPGEILAILDVEPPLNYAFDGGTVTVEFDSTAFDPQTWWDLLEDDRKHEKFVGREPGNDPVDRLLSCRFEFEVPIVSHADP